MDRLPPEQNESHCQVRLPESLQHDAGEAVSWPGRYDIVDAQTALLRLFGVLYQSYIRYVYIIYI